MEPDGTRCTFQVFRRIPITREILLYIVVCVTLTAKREYGSNAARENTIDARLGFNCIVIFIKAYRHSGIVTNKHDTK